MTTPNAPTARELSAEPRCVFCGKRKELREMDGVWLCHGPHEAIALDQLAALRSARDYWKGESDVATAALLAARREGRALRDALGRIETLAHREADSFGLSGNLHEIMDIALAALAATQEER